MTSRQRWRFRGGSGNPRELANLLTVVRRSLLLQTELARLDTTLWPHSSVVCSPSSYQRQEDYLTEIYGSELGRFVSSLAIVNPRPDV